ncbi:hypothetical protein [Dyella flagellata]|uniref:hypothetical protein n=1 Tax=Dyella flagellata TaxID=1867833 RepID=UPI0024E0ABAD|nr:hypothetical protein [Dyella flagellata]
MTIRTSLPFGGHDALYGLSRPAPACARVKKDIVMNAEQEPSWAAEKLAASILIIRKLPNEIHQRVMSKCCG